MRSILFGLLAIAAVTAAPGASAGTIGPHLQERLQTAAPDEEVAVIIRLDGKVRVHDFKDRDRKKRRAKLIRALKKHAGLRRGTLRSELDRGRSRRLRELWLINGVAVVVPARRIQRLAAKRWVSSITLDMTLAVPGVTYGTGAVAGWNLEAVRAPALWQLGYTGQGVVVASLDTGVDSLHPDIGTKWRGGGNSWFDPYGEHAVPTDTNGHGTQVAGLIVGGDASGQAIGVAPDAQWIAAKIYNDAGVGELSAIHQALQWALDPDGNPDVDDAPDVVNNSWGLPETVGGCNSEFADDIAALRAAGIAVVFAGGNSGPNAGTSLSPANSSQNMVTGAVDDSLTVASFSSRGPSACDGGIYPQVVAPGVSVQTADLTFGGLFPQSYIQVSGTSFSAAHVAGGLALLKSAMGTATVSEMEAALLASAVDTGDLGPDNAYGAGVVDLLDAYNQLAAGGPPPQTGDLQFSASTYGVAENGGILTVTVQRVGGSGGAVSVDYATVDGTAQAGQDYLAAFGTLNFADGVTARSFTVTLLDDTVYEGDETFSLQLGNPGGGAGLGTIPTAVATIVDQDPQVVDQDQDGYAVGVDCNDLDANVYPGAPEVKHDDMDQDCNGYDLTIDVVTARYRAKRDRLIVEATSSLGKSAALSVDGYGPMRWNRKKGLWRLVVNGLTSDPGQVTVTGPEGSDSRPTN